MSFDAEVLLADLHRVADDLGRSPSKRDYMEHGRYTMYSYESTFGSWNDAKRAAGLDTLQEGGPTMPEADLLADIARVADDLGKPPSAREYERNGRYSLTVQKKRFGSWNDAKERAGLPVEYEHAIDRGRLLDDLRRVADDLGRSPSMTEYDEHGAFGSRTYQDRFGLWNDAKREAGLECLSPADSKRNHHPLSGVNPEDLGLSPIGERRGQPTVALGGND